MRTHLSGLHRSAAECLRRVRVPCGGEQTSTKSGRRSPWAGCGALAVAALAAVALACTSPGSWRAFLLVAGATVLLCLALVLVAPAWWRVVVYAGLVLAGAEFVLFSTWVYSPDPTELALRLSWFRNLDIAAVAFTGGEDRGALDLSVTVSAVLVHGDLDKKLSTFGIQGELLVYQRAPALDGLPELADVIGCGDGQLAASFPVADSLSGAVEVARWPLGTLTADVVATPAVCRLGVRASPVTTRQLDEIIQVPVQGELLVFPEVPTEASLHSTSDSRVDAVRIAYSDPPAAWASARCANTSPSPVALQIVAYGPRESCVAPLELSCPSLLVLGDTIVPDGTTEGLAGGNRPFAALACGVPEAKVVLGLPADGATILVADSPLPNRWIIRAQNSSQPGADFGIHVRVDGGVGTVRIRGQVTPIDELDEMRFTTRGAFALEVSKAARGESVLRVSCESIYLNGEILQSVFLWRRLGVAWQSVIVSALVGGLLALVSTGMETRSRLLRGRLEGEEPREQTAGSSAPPKKEPRRSTGARESARGRRRCR